MNAPSANSLTMTDVQMTRPSWDSIWLQVATQIGERSLCTRARVGAVIVDREFRVVSTGYNGPPAGFVHGGRPCSEWCGRGAAQDVRNMMGESVFNCVAVHAEANALISADRSKWQGGAMYVVKHPCWECSKLIANSGLVTLVVRPVNPTPEGHHSEQTYDFLEACGVEVVVLDG